MYQVTSRQLPNGTFRMIGTADDFESAKAIAQRQSKVAYIFRDWSYLGRRDLQLVAIVNS